MSGTWQDAMGPVRRRGNKGKDGNRFSDAFYKDGQRNTLLQCNLTIGNVVVLVADATAPRNTWLMGKVTKTFPGKPGLLRIVQRQTRANVT